jgi:glycine hydroxymethyltransferase
MFREIADEVEAYPAGRHRRRSVTTQGMREPEMREIAVLVGRAVRAVPGSAALAEVAEKAGKLVTKFPAYPT